MITSTSSLVTTTTPLSNSARTTILALAHGFATGCGGGVSGGEAGSGGTQALTVEESLQRLGVSTAETARVDHAGDPLPAGYSPLGAAYTLQQNAELIRLGVPSPLHDDPIRWIDPPR